MNRTEIEVRKYRGRWAVTRDGRIPAIQSFERQSHAAAFGRALAWSSGADLVIYNAAGLGVRQARETLSYPKRLD